MNTQGQPFDDILKELRERAKELNCLYQVEETLSKSEESLSDAFRTITDIIPKGYQYPDLARVRIQYFDSVVTSRDFEETSWFQRADLKVLEKMIGSIEVFYIKELPVESEGPFLQEERRLINTIAERISHTIFHRQQREIFREMETSKKEMANRHRGEWRVILNLLRSTDQNLFMLVSRKMANHLCWNGIEEASQLLVAFGEEHSRGRRGEFTEDQNRPSQKKTMENILTLSTEIFQIAEQYLSDSDILNYIQKWVQEDKSSYLVKAAESFSSSLSEIVEALTRYHYQEPELAPSTQIGLNVALIRRFFFDRLDFINTAKRYIEVNDFFDLVHRIIHPADSHGKLGGKSAGLFLAARVLQKATEHAEMLSNLRVPKTWYITSDGIIHFMHYNNLEEVIEQKYKEIDQVRLEYPQIIQVFKNSHFPPEIVKGLSMALDDFEDRPLVVRSSSLLEDSLGTAFSGKYKSLFVANRGTKAERIEALMDAIAEVYASVFGPDPIQYRAERGLLDFHEEMGIMIQEVVGTRIGPYFLPAFAGVAFSNNEFRWSPRIKREDGLIRLVPGLGTRAVDRVSDDYPILLAPGQPGLRVNQSVEEMVRYSPQRIDVINLETNTFETIEITSLLRKHGNEYPNVEKVVSIYEDGRVTRPSGMGINFETDDMIVTFDGLISGTRFVSQLHTIIQDLQAKLLYPVDLEFASDGKNFYLLQCRPQSYSHGSVAVPIPKDIATDRIIFTANKYISNGRVPDITHIVYVDPQKYSEITDLDELRNIGRAVARLNKILPKHQFILMGPGRWGSRGDIKLGVSVTYSDFNNTSVLIEIARKKGNYVPELSFGTHFFQDLVEASIRYLPLYPDDEGVVFNDRFLLTMPSIFSEIAPEFAHLGDAIRVIDVPGVMDGLVLKVMMNGDLGEAIGYVGQPSSSVEVMTERREVVDQAPEDYWTWRMRMAEQIAANTDPEQFGVKAMYIFGSTKNATAGPGSDIDLLVHFIGTDAQREKILVWLDGWSRCLAEMNYLRSGYRVDGLLDVHLVTDDDIRRKTSYAVKIGAVTDSARPLGLGKSIKS